MKRTITTMVLAAIMLVAAAAPAFATHEDESQDTAGYGTEECRPGADFDRTNGRVSSWEPMTMDEYIAAFEVDLGREPNLPAVEATWEFCDKNRDGTLCILRTDPSPYWYTLLDNRPFKG